MDDVMKIVKSLGITGLLIKGVSETIQNEAKKKQQEIVFLGMLLGTIGASLWENSLGSKRRKAKILEKRSIEGWWKNH